jgi:threonine aldolase
MRRGFITVCRFRPILSNLEQQSFSGRGHQRAIVSTTHFSSSNAAAVADSSTRIVDLRSDTVTMPSQAMLQSVMTAKLGDDVFGEDPTVLELEETMADMFGKKKALFVPTGTMANLCAILAHCHTRAAQIMIGSTSHIALWEGGNAANVGGIHTKEITEHAETAEMSVDDIRDAMTWDTDDHWPETKLLCLENTHNMHGGVALSKSYMDKMGGALARDELQIKSHVDGARIFNSVVAQNVSAKDLCENVDSVSVCLSKGLGAPIGSVLIGDVEFIRLAKRARKRCGGGMRQAGVVAAMGLYAVKNNVARLEQDHVRAQRIAVELQNHGFYLPRSGKVDTNIVYFGLPENSLVTKEDLRGRLDKEYGVKLTGGYNKGGSLFRLVTHLGINDQDTDRAIEAIVSLCLRK